MEEHGTGLVHRLAGSPSIIRTGTVGRVLDPMKLPADSERTRAYHIYSTVPFVLGARRPAPSPSPVRRPRSLSKACARGQSTSIHHQHYVPRSTAGPLIRHPTASLQYRELVKTPVFLKSRFRLWAAVSCRITGISFPDLATMTISHDWRSGSRPRVERTLKSFSFPHFPRSSPLSLPSFTRKAKQTLCEREGQVLSTEQF